ncbi:hypothetical protein [Desulfopila aestuarii]|uniref:Uncharacterized protein n=1 Tax=Desulfopila aestuarii DSM 18488 TaxID=1121416 RepID=A0A1M7Y0T5_9BACT|nr:hypothetical protein [Desulfopila aestuarii]SHO45314.1 hypothetical protein SAMN02745220_01036 [Desulfopila aestuarii DSM 18488]
MTDKSLQAENNNPIKPSKPAEHNFTRFLMGTDAPSICPRRTDYRSRGIEKSPDQHFGVHDALVKIVLNCLAHLNRAANTPQPFSGYWIDPKLYLPDMDITVMLFDPVLQEMYLGSLYVDDEDNEIWVDQYGMKLDRIAMWAELPYPQNQMALS